jgi:hypothetical protein
MSNKEITAKKKEKQMKKDLRILLEAVEEDINKYTNSAYRLCGYRF